LVRFYYSSETFRSGMLVSLISMATLLLAAVVALKLRKF
jgi:hypothetical protein